MERQFSGPRFRDRGFERFEKPVKVGETYNVEIKETGSKGDGIARVNNFVVFVANAKKGDKCKIKITQVASRFAFGEKVEEGYAEEEPKEEKVEKEVKKPEKKIEKSKGEKKKEVSKEDKIEETSEEPEDFEDEEVED